MVIVRNNKQLLINSLTLKLHCAIFLSESRAKLLTCHCTWWLTYQVYLPPVASLCPILPQYITYVAMLRPQHIEIVLNKNLLTNGILSLISKPLGWRHRRKQDKVVYKLTHILCAFIENELYLCSFFLEK